MNIILFSPPEVQLPLPGNDARSRHILTVLRRRPGDGFDVGLINGPRGRAILESIGADGSLVLVFAWGEEPTPLPPIHLIVGLPRPQTARDILREGASLGISALDFVCTDRGEPGYARSTLWTSREWESLLVAGAAQAFCTRLPAVRHGSSLAVTVAALPADATRIALDNYEASGALGRVDLPAGKEIVVALGSERGWSPAERDLLRQQAFTFAHLGERVLRTETACITAVAVLKARLGLL